MQQKTKWEEFFDAHAPMYNQNIFTKNTFAEVDFVTEVLAVSPGASLLDVGCGTGRHAIELARRGYCVTGVDLSAGMLKQAEIEAKTAEVQVVWLHCDATTFRSTQLFDGIICLCEGAFGLLGQVNEALRQPLAILQNMADALKPNARCLFTVLNGLAMIRRHTQTEVEQGLFDPVSISEVSRCLPPGDSTTAPLRERAFLPTELVLLFQLAGLEVLYLWGGTAGRWGRRPVELDEMEIMVLAQKAAEPATTAEVVRAKSKITE